MGISDYIRPLPFKRVVLNKPVTHFLGNTTITSTGIRAIEFPNLWKNNKKLSDVKNNLALYQYDANLFQLSTYNCLFFDIVAIPETLDRFAETGLIKSEYVDAAKDLFATTKVIPEDQKIEIVYRLGFDFAHNFLKKIWRPSKLINDSIDRILKNNFNKKT